MARRLSGLAVLLWGSLSLIGCQSCGTQCQVTQSCHPAVTMEKVEKDGWDVECKQICIPPVHCPFSDPCERGCGKVIAVKRLKKDTLECGERCVVEYKLSDPCPPRNDSADESSDSEEETSDSSNEQNVEPAPAPAGL